MATSGSLNQSMEKAVKHYSSLFKLPSYKKMILFQALIITVAGLLSTAILFTYPEGLFKGFSLSVSLFLVNLFVDHFLHMSIIKSDPVYDLRRIVGLSLFCWAFWLVFIVIGVPTAMLFGMIWGIKLCLLGFSTVVILRLIVLFSSSSTHYARLFVSSFIQPFCCIIPFLVLWRGTGYPMSSILSYFVFSSAAGLISSFLFISVLNNEGIRTLGIPSMSLFKAFLLNWIIDLNAPFEEFLEKLGENQNVEVTLLQFCSSKPKAAIIVPSVHPGPFKNIGSSLLPSMLKTAMEKQLNCVACVPHGVLSHEFDLASQAQNQRIIKRVVESAYLEGSETKATSFLKVNGGAATVCCQVFGKFAFVSLTLAPQTTEDLPKELETFAMGEAERLGLDGCVTVNAHNSIDGKMNTQEALEAFKPVVVSCLENAVTLKQLPFEVGAATVIPKEFGLREGMGPGGITVVVAKVGEQKVSYVVIDGNNMVPELREKILLALKPLGIDDGEVFTTDTHSVNAVIMGNRGYHPIGEAINHEVLIEYVKNVTQQAVSNLESVKSVWQSITVQNVKVIGEKQLESLCLLIDNTLRKAKRYVAPIFVTCGLFLMLFLTFF